jgi:hypothetical protein
MNQETLLWVEAKATKHVEVLFLCAHPLSNNFFRIFPEFFQNLGRTSKPQRRMVRVRSSERRLREPSELAL